MAGRITRVVSLVAICLGVGVVVPTPAGASKPVVNGAGTVYCNGTSAKIKFVPALTSTPRPTTTTVKMKLNCTGATGNAAVTILAAKVSGKTVSSGLSCADIAPRSAGVPFGVNATQNPMVMDVKWKASGGKVNPTRIVAPSWAFWASSYIVFAGTAAPPPRVTLTGSYAGEYAESGAAAPVSDAALAATCASAKGLKKVTANLTSLTVYVPDF